MFFSIKALTGHLIANFCPAFPLVKNPGIIFSRVVAG
jgi:hypothetical protein